MTRTKEKCKKCQGELTVLYWRPQKKSSAPFRKFGTYCWQCHVMTVHLGKTRTFVEVPQDLAAAGINFKMTN